MLRTATVPEGKCSQTGVTELHTSLANSKTVGADMAYADTAEIGA